MSFLAALDRAARKPTSVPRGRAVLQQFILKLMHRMASFGAASLAMLSGLLLAAQVSQTKNRVKYDSASRIWTLNGGPVEYRLRRAGNGVTLDYFGPAGKAAWPASSPGVLAPAEMWGTADGQSITPDDLDLVTVEPVDLNSELALRYRHKRLPLEIEVVYSTAGGVITRRTSLINSGTTDIRIDAMPSIGWRLPAANYDLTYLWGGWGQERQMATEPLSVGSRVFTADRGRSTNGYASWFALRDRDRGVTYMAQLAWSGNWQMSFRRDPGGDRMGLGQLPLNVEMGMQFDFGGPLTLKPGSTFVLPQAVFTATAGDLDDAANQLHRYQRSVIRGGRITVRRWLSSIPGTRFRRMFHSRR